MSLPPDFGCAGVGCREAIQAVREEGLTEKREAPHKKHIQRNPRTSPPPAEEESSSDVESLASPLSPARRPNNEEDEEEEEEDDEARLL